MNEEKSPSLTDLIRDCRRGDDDAWRDLLNRLAPLVFSICRDNRLSQEESLDIFGQVSYLLLKNIKRIRSASKIFAYVATMTRRQVYDRFYRDRLMDYVENERLEENVDAKGRGPEQIYEEDHQRQILLEALSSLPDKEYRLLTALFLDENEPSYDEVARRLKIPVASIGPTRGRALQKLRRRLRRMGYKFDVF